MSGPTDVKMTTCSKCRNKNPSEAAFCGFCGADLRSVSPPEKATMFGYAADFGLDQLQPPGSPAPAAPEPVQQPKAPGAEATPGGALGKQTSDDVPTTSYSAGQGYVAGRYWIQQELDVLAVGQRSRAKDTKGEAVVDVVLVDPAVFPSPLDMERARRELRQLQKVSARHLVRVLDHGKADDDRLYVVTECVEGQTVADLVAKGPLALEQVLSIICDVGAGLAAAQTVGVIHRDVAPGNVVVASDGDAKLRTYGVAPLIKGHVFGTPEFVSPEQAGGRPVDQRSSIYSLGALMFHMLAGQPPFKGEPDKVLEQHQQAEPPAIGELRPELEGNTRLQGLLAKAMAKSSSRRHLTLRQFLREVEGLGTPPATAPAASRVSGASPPQGASPSSPAPPPVAQPAAPPSRPSPTPLAVLDLGATLIQSESPVMPATEAKARSQAAVQPVGGAKPVVVTPAPTGSPALPVDHGAPTMIEGIADRAAGQAPTADLGPSAKPQSAIATVPPAAAVSTPAEVSQAAAVDKVKQGQASPTSPPVTAGTANTVVGETQGRARVRLKQTNEQQAAREPSPESRASGGAQPTPAGAAKGFRETMWFFKGEVESAMAEKGEPAAPEEAEPDASELVDKYEDDGTIDDDEAARRLSLRTGRTQMMQRAQVPSGSVPGERMRAEDFIDEMNRGRRVGIAIFVGVVVVLVVGGLFLLL